MKETLVLVLAFALAATIVRAAQVGNHPHRKLPHKTGDKGARNENVASFTAEKFWPQPGCSRPRLQNRKCQ
jgi:hypothetical protein